MSGSEIRFVGAIPELYDRHMGPVLFEPYAKDIALRVPPGKRHILELAAGTGRVTRHLLAALPADGELIATDLNEPMLAVAKTQLPNDPRLKFQQADMQALPLPDGSAEVVVCQFGLMFVPDKALAMREIKRVLTPGGILLLSTWDDLARNPASKQLHELAFAAMPDNPPVFMKTPFSMPDPNALLALATEAGLRGVRVDTVAATAEAESAEHLSIGFARGNPLSTQLAERGLDVDAFQAKVAAALSQSFGDRPCRSPLSAHVLTAWA